MKLFMLYDAESDFTTKNAEVQTFLDIPSGGTTRYAAGDQVANPSSADFGKYIMPVFTSGQYKCDSLFVASALTDWGDDWAKPAPE